MFLVRAGPSVVHSGLKKDVLLNCAFSVDHHADLTIKWVLLRKGGSKKVLFAYKVSTKKVEHQDKRVEAFLAEIPRGNASLLLRGVEVRDEGNYVCSVAASSLLGEQDIRLQVLGNGSWGQGLTCGECSKYVAIQEGRLTGLR